MSELRSHTGRLVLEDGLCWVRRGDGLLYSALPIECAAEIGALRSELGVTLAWLKERMPCTTGKCCEDIRARITALEALTDDTRLCLTCGGRRFYSRHIPGRDTRAAFDADDQPCPDCNPNGEGTPP